MTITTPVELFIPALARPATATTPVRIYGSIWNVASLRIRRLMARHGVLHRYLDVEARPDQRELLRRRLCATVALPVVNIDGEWLVAPTVREVERALREHGLIAQP